jgi:hypothetical protein
MVYDKSDETIIEENIDQLKLYVGKTFHDWNQLAKFMAKYTAAKDYRIWIGGREKKDNIIQEIKKRTYLCHHAGNPNSGQKVISIRESTSCQIGYL